MPPPGLLALVFGELLRSRLADLLEFRDERCTLFPKSAVGRGTLFYICCHLYTFRYVKSAKLWFSLLSNSLSSCSSMIYFKLEDALMFYRSEIFPERYLTMLTSIPLFWKIGFISSGLKVISSEIIFENVDKDFPALLP